MTKKKKTKKTKKIKNPLKEPIPFPPRNSQFSDLGVGVPHNFLQFPQKFPLNFEKVGGFAAVAK